MNDKAKSFEQLVDIFKQLRDPEKGCPWDIKQTHESLTEHLIEESYELLDAINSNDVAAIREELGDVLLQVMLHSQIADDDSNFNVYDVIKELSDKLVERHPHVFGDLEIETAEDVKKNWDQIKNDKRKTGRLSGVPKAAPALLKAEIIGKKVANANFDWEEVDDIKAKVKEELEEFLDTDAGSAEQTEEFGDLLFTLAQLARRTDISSEAALQAACKKFTKRYEHMESSAGSDLAGHSKDELAQLWENAKS